jgi:hypothetical protein
MTPYEIGRSAFLQGVSQIDCPYLRASHDYDLWKEGWKDAWWASLKRWQSEQLFIFALQSTTYSQNITCGYISA